MTLREAVAQIGTTREHAVSASMRVTVAIRDVKTAYGMLKAYVVPVTGDGGQWIDLAPLTSSGQTSPRHTPRLDFVNCRGE